MPRKRLYVGILPITSEREIFALSVTPTEKNCKYAAAIGPFRTRRGAEFMQKHGYNNPHCQCVADAERIARAQSVALSDGNGQTTRLVP